jgi:beta-carotene 3-hydroxylase
MIWIFYILIALATFLFMEFVAWVTHKYVMHGVLWYLHEDHHDGGYHPFQKNDAFFLIFAVPCWLCIMFGLMNAWGWMVSIGAGIFMYGWCYFLVHDVIIHQRFKWFTRSNNHYIKVIRWAHKMHHKHRVKEGGESFGLLIVPAKYWDKVRKDEAMGTLGKKAKTA